MESVFLLKGFYLLCFFEGVIFLRVSCHESTNHSLRHWYLNIVFFVPKPDSLLLNFLSFLLLKPHLLTTVWNVIATCEKPELNFRESLYMPMCFFIIFAFYFLNPLRTCEKEKCSHIFALDLIQYYEDIPRNWSIFTIQCNSINPTASSHLISRVACIWFKWLDSCRSSHSFQLLFFQNS